MLTGYRNFTSAVSRIECMKIFMNFFDYNSVDEDLFKSLVQHV